MKQTTTLLLGVAMIAGLSTAHMAEALLPSNDHLSVLEVPTWGENFEKLSVFDKTQRQQTNNFRRFQAIEKPVRMVQYNPALEVRDPMISELLSRSTDQILRRPIEDIAIRFQHIIYTFQKGKASNQELLTKAIAETKKIDIQIVSLTKNIKGPEVNAINSDINKSVDMVRRTRNDYRRVMKNLKKLNDKISGKGVSKKDIRNAVEVFRKHQNIIASATRAVEDAKKALKAAQALKAIAGVSAGGSIAAPAAAAAALAGIVALASKKSTNKDNS